MTEYKRDQYDTTLGEELAGTKISRNLISEELGKMVGVSKQLINYYIRGQRIPSIKTIRDMEKALGTEPD